MCVYVNAQVRVRVRAPACVCLMSTPPASNSDSEPWIDPLQCVCVCACVCASCMSCAIICICLFVCEVYGRRAPPRTHVCTRTDIHEHTQTRMFRTRATHQLAVLVLDGSKAGIGGSLMLHQ